MAEMINSVFLQYDKATGKVSLSIGDMTFETYRGGTVKWTAYEFHLTSFFGCLGAEGQVEILKDGKYVSKHTTKDSVQLTLWDLI